VADAIFQDNEEMTSSPGENDSKVEPRLGFTLLQLLTGLMPERLRSQSRQLAGAGAEKTCDHACLMRIHKWLPANQCNGKRCIHPHFDFSLQQGCVEPH